jgi:FMN phosphatase YigB (HAD superfamily)
MITALLFDFGGTLDGPRHWLDRFLVHYRAAGIEIERAELDPAYEHATRAGYQATRVVQRFGLVDLARFLVGNQVEFLAKNGPVSVRQRLMADGPKGLHRTVEKITAGFVEETRAGLAMSRPLLDELRRRYRIGVVSNFYGNLERVLAEAKFANLIGATIDSARIGAFKPDARIFEAAVRALGITAPDVAMVGDSLDKDCRPARALGLRTVWFNPNGVQASPDAADFTIRELTELKTIEWGDET